MQNIDQKKHKTGPAPRPLVELRTVVVTVKITIAEAALLDEKRGHHGRAAWLRAAGLDLVLTPTPTKRWQSTWEESARLAACLTQINNLAVKLNAKNLTDGEVAAAEILRSEISQTRELLAEFRASISTV